MDHRPDIWHHLKDHATVPPPELRERLLLLLDTFAEDHAAEHEAMENRAVFQKLLEYPVPPPATVTSAINAAIKPGGQNPRPKNQTLRLFLAFTAAACFLLLISGIILYNTGLKKERLPLAIHKPATRAGINPTLTTPIPAHHIPAGPAIAANPAAETQSPQLSLAVDGGKLSLVDNNLLTTFTDYRYPALKDYVDAGTRIHLDQYTDISLSPAMIATLKMLYDTKPDGKPDRKARKTRERLEQWESKDKKQFDLHAGSNPLDPVDLAEFIFPPLFSFGRHAHAHTTAAPPAAAMASPDNIESSSPLTVSYRLTLVSRKTNNNIAETYNGGVQTLFAAGGHARLRLASLMRIQSLFLQGKPHTVTMLAESAKPQLETTLTARQWQACNAKYADAAYDLTADTTRLLGYDCKKALIRLHDGRTITAWYTPRIQEPAQSILEPAFAAIPGLVMRYEYTCRHRTVRYTATTLSRRPIDPSVFNITSTP